MADLEFVSTRVFPVPREKVWEAWTDPKKLALWWGPKGFTNTFELFDLKPGGTWKFVMHGPGGRDYPNESRFVEIVKPERILFDHLSEGHKFRATATFEDQGGKTKVTYRMLFESAEEYAKVRGFVPQANEQNFDRLEAQLK